MSIHKRIPALLLGVILLFAGIPAGRISAQAADTTQQLNNIVLFAQFPDADTDNFMADKTDTAIAICNDTSTPRSLTSYIDAISYGNRLIMMYEGHVVVDVSGEEKKNLTVEQLLNLFSRASGSDEADDKLLLS